MIFAQTYYKPQNWKLLAIIEQFNTWRYYLKSCKYKVFLFTDHNNLCQFKDTKN